jgi:hypothetical protein
MNLVAQSVKFYSRTNVYLKPGLAHLFMYVFGRFGIVRRTMVRFYQQNPKTFKAYTGASLVDKFDVDQTVAQIRTDGFSPNLTLSKSVVDEFLAFTTMATCYGDGKIDKPFRYGDGNAHPYRLGRYKDAVNHSPLLQKLSTDPQLLSVARAYLGKEPVLMCARLWWSLAGPAQDDEKIAAGQGFHYDIDGYRGVTFFFYLTDVTMNNGPHVYVSGTHNKKKLAHLASIHKNRQDADIVEAYGLENQHILVGPAGSGFAEDIFGYHRGMHPETADRLIVQVRYGLRRYGDTDE